MIDAAAQRLADRLSELGFFDQVCGLVHAQKKNDGGIVKTLPACPNGEGDDYDWLTPDSEKAAIAYFEMLFARSVEALNGNRGETIEAGLRLVVWYNTKRLSPILPLSEMIAACVSKLNGVYEDSHPISRLSVSPASQPILSQAAIFSGWTYDEAEQQMFMLPFRYFAFDFSVFYAYSFASECLTVPAKVDADCC